MKRYILLAAGVVAALAVAGGVSSAGTPPSPPLFSHHTDCTLDGTLPFDQWTPVHMVLPNGDTFWIDSPSDLSGHYVIQSYRVVYTDSTVVPASDDPGWSSWYPKGKKTGPTDKSTVIECKGSFDVDTPYWVDSIDVLVPSP
jgi:hypothetical protein